MDRKELAKLIKNRVIVIGTDLKHIESIAKYSSKNQQFADAFLTLFMSLLSTVYIELFKLFDGNDKEAQNYNVYALINMIEDNNKKYHKKLSKYNADIRSIKNRRNHFYGHELGKSGPEVYKAYRVSYSLQELLQCIADICFEVDPDLGQNIYVRNAIEFDEWCLMSLNSIDEICDLHDRFVRAGVTSEEFYDGLNNYLSSLSEEKRLKIQQGE